MTILSFRFCSIVKIDGTYLGMPHRHNSKFVSSIFYQIFIFSSNDSPSKTMKNVFYLIEKALFVLEILKFL